MAPINQSITDIDDKQNEKQAINCFEYKDL